MEGRIVRIQLNKDTHTVTVTYAYGDRQISKGASYTEYRWKSQATSIVERVAYATAEATMLCVEGLIGAMAAEELG